MSHPTGVPHHGMTKFCRKNSDRRSREKLLNVGIWSLLHTNKEITNKRSPSNRWCTSKQPENVTNNFCILRCFSHCKWKHDWRKDYNFPKTKLNMQFPIPLYSHSFLWISPIVLRYLPYTSLRLNFGAKTMWYLQFQRVWFKLWSFIIRFLCV